MDSKALYEMERKQVRERRVEGEKERGDVSAGRWGRWQVYRATRDPGDFSREAELEPGAWLPYFQNCYLCLHLLNY